jgi:hypothetical protein
VWQVTAAPAAKPYDDDQPHFAATHRGPHGPVRARRWHGDSCDGTLAFLRRGGSVAYRVEGFRPGQLLVIDLDGDRGEEVAHPGDWFVWELGEWRVVPAAVFAALYRVGGAA